MREEWKNEEVKVNRKPLFTQWVFCCGGVKQSQACNVLSEYLSQRGL